MHFASSDRCACEPTENAEVTKDETGIFRTDAFPMGRMTLNVSNGKVTSINVFNDIDYECCTVLSGNYIPKPKAASNGKIPPLTSINAANEDFISFWNSFQSKMDIKDSILPYISFPYAVSCSYLDATSVSKTDFDRNGPAVFVNGNAFISGVFSAQFYPNLKGLYVAPYLKNGYMDSNLSSVFESRFGNLDDIFVISEIGKQDEQIGTKAYFKKINAQFMFIGFESVETGE
jgi:hypothetical protein